MSRDDGSAGVDRVKVDRSAHTPRLHQRAILGDLARLWFGDRPDAFRALVEGPYAHAKVDVALDPDALEAEMLFLAVAAREPQHARRRSEIKKAMLVKELHRCLACCVLAERAFEANDQLGGWSYLMDAQLSRGSLLTRLSLATRGPKLAAQVGIDAANARHAPSRQTKKDALAWIATQGLKRKPDQAVAISERYGVSFDTARDWVKVPKAKG